MKRKNITFSTHGSKDFNGHGPYYYATAYVEYEDDSDHDLTVIMGGTTRSKAIAEARRLIRGVERNREAKGERGPL